VLPRLSDARARDFLSGSSRERREVEVDDDDPVVKARLAPGKRKSTDDGDHVEARPVDAPAARPTAVRVDRYAEADDGESGLSAALGLISESRGGRALPSELAQRLEAQLGISLEHVRIHDDARANQAAAEINARAFTIGNDIYFGYGAYDATSVAGIELIAHEVAHVAQQARGTAPAGRGVSKSTDSHEREAESFARGFQQRKSVTYTAKAGDDPATLVEYARNEGRRIGLPFQAELEEQLGSAFHFVEAFTGPAAQIACEALGASAFVVRNIIMLADPSPNRELLLHELSHVQQMGRRTAPSKFERGSLKVSGHDDAAEVEARGPAVAPRVSADPDTIHRAGPNDAKPAGDGAGTPDEAGNKEKRIKAFFDDANGKLETFPKTGGDGEEYHAFRDAASGHRYTSSSKQPWNRNDYAAVINATSMKASDSTYTKDLAEIRANKEKYRVANVTTMTWAIIADGTWVGEVEDIRPDKRKVADPEEQFAAYFKAIKVLKPKGRLVGFTYADNAESYKEANCTFDTASATAYREAMRDAIAKGYAALGEKAWQTFYDEVMGGSKAAGGLFPSKYNGVTGSIFEKIVRDTTGGQLRQEKPLFVNPPGTNHLATTRDGDDAFTKSPVIVDAKAAEAGIDEKQALDYNKIITVPIPAYFASEGAAGKASPQHFYKGVAYTVAGQAIANKAKGQIEKLFAAEGDAIWNKFHVTPTPDGLKEFLLKFNPTVRLQSKEKGSKTSYTFSDPVTGVSGVKMKKAVVNTDGGTKVTGGSVDMSIDMGKGAIKNDNVQKPIAADADGGTVENKFGGFKSTLDKVLGAVDVDAKLIEGGVEAKVSLKAGAAKIPQFEVDGATLTARYVNDALTIEGEVGLTHKSKKISGKVKVSWEGNAWSFDGQATLAEGLVPGLSAVTLGVSYAGGKTKIYCAQAAYERKFGAITLKGTVRNLEYDVDKGAFSGGAEIDADLGMFGKATAAATLENNDLKSATFAYDSPEFKYPAKSDKPAFKGTVGGTVNYNAGKWSGSIRGAANLNIPALKSVAGEAGAGLAVDAHVEADGSYSGTIKTTTPLKFGKHLEVPSVSCTLNKDGSVTGSFEIKVVKLKYLETARVKCTVSKEGIELEEADFSVAFGSQDKGKFWGTLTAGYKKDKGLTIGGEVNYKIKDDMVATGTLKYSTETHAVSLDLTVKEIVVIDKKISKQLFKASKQIPVVNVYGLGIYIDIGLDLGFDFGFKITTTPKVALEGLSLETWEFTKLGAKLKVGGDIYAQLTGTPKLGIGVFALDPSILRGGGGLKVPIVGRLDIKPDAEFGLDYTSGGGVSGSAKLGLAGNFGITGSVKPYAEFSVLNDMWNPKWEGEALAAFEILKPKELFNFTVDLAGDSKKDEAPALPEQNSAKEAGTPTGDKTATAKAAAPTERGGDGNKSQPAKQGEVAEGGDEGPFSLSALMGKLKGMPGFATAEKIFKYAKKIWAVVKPIYDIVEPLMDLIAKRIEAIIDLFDTEAPTGSNLGPWLWKLAKKLFNIGFGGLGDLASAIRTLLGQAAGFAKKLINKAVQDGHIGVKRHSYYIWMPWPKDDIEFMAAAEYKVNIPGIADLGHDGPPGFLLTPGGAVSLVLYEALGAVGVGYTYRGNSDINQPYNDIWTGSGARG